MAIGKADLVSYVAKATKLTKTDSQKAVEAVFEGIAFSLEKGEEVRLIGFGSFSTQKSAEREGRNPRTGEKIKIPSSTRAVFKAGKDLRDAVNRRF
jgi:DNA-binding protein HU-beta